MTTGAVSGILAALILQFGYLLDDYHIVQPPVEWYSGARKSGGEELGATQCGYKTNKSTGVKRPFCRIYLHKCLKYSPTALAETYVHELAHAVDWISDEDWDNHGGQWKKIMRRWDLFSPTANGGTGVPWSCHK